MTSGWMLFEQIDIYTAPVRYHKVGACMRFFRKKDCLRTIKFLVNHGYIEHQDGRLIDNNWHSQMDIDTRYEWPVFMDG